MLVDGMVISESNQIVGDWNTTRKSRVSLVGDTGLLAFSESIAILVGIFSQVLLTRGLSANEYGNWIVIFDAGLTIFLLADPGISTVIGREIPSNPSASSQFLSSIARLQFVLLTSTIVVSYCLWSLLDVNIGFPVKPMLLICIGAFSIAVSSVYKAFLRSTGKASWEAFMRVVDRLLLAFGYYLVFDKDGTLNDYSMTMAIVPFFSACVIIFLAFFHARKLSTDYDVRTEETYTMSVIIKKSLPYFAFIFLLQIMDRIDKFILYLNSTPTEQIATYGISLLVFFTGMAVIRVIRNVMLPWFSENAITLQPLVVRKYNQAFAFVCFLIPMGVLAAQLVMMTIPIVVFPEEYIFPEHGLFTSESIFRILLVTLCLQMVISPSWESVRAFSPPSSLNVTAFSGVAIAVLFGLFSIPVWGVYGAAMMTSVAPFVFLIISHRLMPEVIRSSLSRSYYVTLFSMVVFSFSPLIFFIDGITPISGYLVMVSLSAVISLVVYSYWRSIMEDQPPRGIVG